MRNSGPAKAKHNYLLVTEQGHGRGTFEPRLVKLSSQSAFHPSGLYNTQCISRAQVSWPELQQLWESDSTIVRGTHQTKTLNQGCPRIPGPRIFYQGSCFLMLQPVLWNGCFKKMLRASWSITCVMEDKVKPTLLKRRMKSHQFQWCREEKQEAWFTEKARVEASFIFWNKKTLPPWAQTTAAYCPPHVAIRQGNFSHSQLQLP